MQRICKAISVLDAILCQDWQYRYYSYNAQWGEGEEFFEMRDGEGRHLLILFKQDACIINGVHNEYEPADKSLLTSGLPDMYHEFMYGEPAASIGTNFCIWTDRSGNWRFNDTLSETGAAELLAIFDHNPASYIAWAEEYFDDRYKENGIAPDSVQKLYNGETLTKDMVFSIVDDLDDWEQLQEDIAEINYPSEI
ncbi:hypothetical protein ACYULU_03245 [Breznakiellaceae bacterium SP9]